MPRLRIATYNVLWGGKGREARIRDVLRAIDADVVVLTEITSPESLEALAPAVGEHRAMSGPANYGERTAIVSRWPLLASGHFGPPWNRRKWIHATIQPSGGPQIRVHGIALIAHQLWTQECGRAAEIKCLMAHVREQPPMRCVLAGDFNALTANDSVLRHRAPINVRAQWWSQFGLIPRWALTPLNAAGFTDCYRACHPQDDGFTIASTNPTARIDYIFASERLATALRTCDVFQAGDASDHLPVVADFDPGE